MIGDLGFAGPRWSRLIRHVQAPDAQGELSNHNASHLAACRFAQHASLLCPIH
jgi:hypothetical protein